MRARGSRVSGDRRGGACDQHPRHPSRSMSHALVSKKMKDFKGAAGAMLQHPAAGGVRRLVGRVEVRKLLAVGLMRSHVIALERRRLFAVVGCEFERGDGI